MDPAPHRWQLVAAFAVVYVVWGSTYLAMHLAIEGLPTFFVAGARFVVSGAALYAWGRAQGHTASLGHWRAAGLTGLLLLVGGNGAVIWAVGRVPTGVASLIIATVPLWMVVLQGRMPTLRVAAGLALGIVGIAVLVGPGSLGGTPVDTVGALVLVGAALSWSLGSLVQRNGTSHPSTLMATGMQMLAGGAILLGVAALHGEFHDVTALQGTPRAWAAVAYLAVFGSFLGFTCYAWLLRVVQPSLVATYAYVNPIVAVLLGAWVVGEALAPRVVIAALTIVVGVVVTVSGRSHSRA